MILARYSVKDILRLSSKHMTQLQLPIHWSAYLTDGDEGLNLRGTARRMPHSQLNATRWYQVLSCGWWDTAGICSRLWQLPKLPNHAQLDGGTAKDWKRDDVCSLRPLIPSHKAHSDIHTADAGHPHWRISPARMQDYTYGHPIIKLPFKCS